MLLTLGIVSGTIIRGGPESFTWIYEHWTGLVSASIIYSFVHATILYVASFREGALLALGGNSGNHIYNVNVFHHLEALHMLKVRFDLQFWMGRELNPSIGSLDLKSFFELRPGLIGWVLIDISMACEQAVRNGGSITDSMALILFFQTAYVLDALYNEVCPSPRVKGHV